MPAKAKTTQETTDDAPIRVTSWHGGNFAMVPQVVVRKWSSYIGSDGLSVYTVLCAHADNDTGQAYPKQKTIAGLLGISTSMVSTVIQDMAELGLLRIEPKYDKRGMFAHNEYYLLKPDLPTIPLDQAPRFKREEVRKERRKNDIIHIPTTAEIELALGRQLTDTCPATNGNKPDNLQTQAGQLTVSYKLYSRELDSSELEKISAANNAAPTQAALDLKGDEAIGVDDPQPQPQPETPKPNNLLHFKEKEGLSLTDDNPTQTPPPMPSTPSPSSADLFDALERAAPIARQKVSYGKGDVQDYYALLVKLNTGGWTVEQFNASKSAKVTGRFGKAAKRLRAKGCDLNIMADQYGAPEGFWWSTYWKGVKEKQYPEPEDIEDTWNDWLKVTAPTTKHATTPDAQPQVVPPSVLPRHRPEDDKEYADPAEVADMARQAKAILAEKIAEREARQALRRTA